MLVPDEIRPRFNHIVTTCEHHENDVIKGNVIFKPKGELKELQKVVAIGDTVRDLKVGDLVKLNLDRYQVRKFKEGSIKEDMQSMQAVKHYDVPTVELNNTTYFFIFDADIDYVVTKYHEEPDETIIIPKTKLIV